MWFYFFSEKVWDQSGHTVQYLIIEIFMILCFSSFLLSVPYLYIIIHFKNFKYGYNYKLRNLIKAPNCSIVLRYSYQFHFISLISPSSSKYFQFFLSCSIMKKSNILNDFNFIKLFSTSLLVKPTIRVNFMLTLSR